MALLNTHCERRAVAPGLSTFAGGLLIAVSLVGCAPPVAPTPIAAKTTPGDSGPAFLSAPTPTNARRLTSNVVELTGRVAPGAVVTLRSPDGQVLESPAATAEGAWTLRAPVSSAPRLYAVSAAIGGRTLRGEGALLTAPGPAPAALLLRAGAPALVWDPPTDALILEAMDFDSGGVAVAGVGPPKTSLRLSLDDRPASVGRTDAEGRFALMAVQSDLQPGPHVLRLEGAGHTVEARVDAKPAAPPEGQAYAVRKVEGGWRIDWDIPGGGAQSAVVFAPGFWGAGG